MFVRSSAVSKNTPEIGVFFFIFMDRYSQCSRQIHDRPIVFIRVFKFGGRESTIQEVDDVMDILGSEMLNQAVNETIITIPHICHRSRPKSVQIFRCQ